MNNTMGIIYTTKDDLTPVSYTHLTKVAQRTALVQQRFREILRLGRINKAEQELL